MLLTKEISEIVLIDIVWFEIKVKFVTKEKFSRYNYKPRVTDQDLEIFLNAICKKIRLTLQPIWKYGKYLWEMLS